MSEPLAAEVKALVSKVIKIPEERIDPNADIFADLGIDSLLGVEIFAALDRKYHIDIPEDKLKNVATLNDLVKLVESLKVSK